MEEAGPFYLGDRKTAGHYVFLVGIRERNFVAYNVDAYPMTEEEVLDSDISMIEYKEASESLGRMKSETWSCDCDWFFVVVDNGILLMNVHNNRIIMCKKHSHRFIKLFADAPPDKELKKMFKENKK